MPGERKHAYTLSVKKITQYMKNNHTRSYFPLLIDETPELGYPADGSIAL